MKFSIKTATLRNALNRLAFIPGGGGPVLQSSAVCLELGMEDIMLTRTTNEAHISVSVADDLQVLDGGNPALVSFAAFAGILSAARASVVEIEADEKALKVSAGKAVLSLKVFSEDPIPAPEVGSMGEPLVISVNELRSCLEFAKLATHPGHQNSIYDAVCLRSDEKGLRFIGNCGKWCHVATAQIKGEANAMLATESVTAILRALDGVSGDASLLISESILRCDAGEVVVSVGLVNQVYPDIINSLANYDKQEAVVLGVSKEELSEELATCAAVIKDEGTKIACEIGGGVWKMKNAGAAESAVITSLPCKSAKDRQFGLNGKMASVSIAEFQSERDGSIELSLYETAICVQQPNRYALIALTVLT